MLNEETEDKITERKMEGTTYLFCSRETISG